MIRRWLVGVIAKAVARYASLTKPYLPFPRSHVKESMTMPLSSVLSISTNSCSKQTGAPMQLAVFDNLKVLKGDDNLIAFKKNPDSAVTRKSCKDCGSFCYKLLGEGGPNVVPVGALSDEYIKPTCNIFVADKGNHPVLDSSLACHDGFP